MDFDKIYDPATQLLINIGLDIGNRKTPLVNVANLPYEDLANEIRFELPVALKKHYFESNHVQAGSSQMSYSFKLCNYPEEADRIADVVDTTNGFGCSGDALVMKYSFAENSLGSLGLLIIARSHLLRDKKHYVTNNSVMSFQELQPGPQNLAERDFIMLAGAPETIETTSASAVNKLG